MSLDPLLPTAPARVRALLLPVGRLTSDRFTSFVARLREEHVVHLRHVTADPRPNRNMFSPLAFPDGVMFYDLSTHLPPPSRLALWPFDLYRDALVVIALADGRELRHLLSGRPGSSPHPQPGTPSALEQNLRILYQQLEDLRDDHPKALVHRIVIFDYDPHNGAEPNPEADREIPVPEGVVAVPWEAACTRTAMKTVMCDLSSALLAEMTSLAKSFEAMTHVESPGRNASGREVGGRMWGEATDPPTRNPQMPPTPKRSASESFDGPLSRMSMPPTSSAKLAAAALAGSIPEMALAPINSSGLPNPPTTFDDIAAAGGGSGRAFPETIVRPPTADGTSSRGSSLQDKVTVQGFGPGSLSERLRSKGRGRVAVVVGSMYLQAGRWNDALRELSEAATITRAINDHVWHGKALEMVLVTVLLMGWAGLEFIVPQVLLLSSDKSSANAPLIQEDDVAQPRHLQQLQGIMPDLLDRILGLYSRMSAESLPALPMSEAAIRACKALSAMYLTSGKLIKTSLDMMVSGTYPAMPPTFPRLSVTPSKHFIIKMALKAFPPSSPELLTTVDRVSILSGIASVLGPLGAHRKKAMVIRELVSVLVTGLIEARTRGAAEVGIHPAAGLIALTNAGAQKTSGLDLGDSDVEQGIDTFLASLCSAYGVVGHDVAKDLHGLKADTAASTSQRIQAHSAARFFGFPAIKLNVLRACINFSEALPDYSGVLRFSSDLMRTAGAGVAAGTRKGYAWPMISRDEQLRLVNNVVKTSALASRMGPGGPLLADYWDEFLVGGLVLEPTPTTRKPVAQAKSSLPENMAAQGQLGDVVVISGQKNPFIHNPFASHQAGGDGVDGTLVAGEPAIFRVTLRNPYDVDLDVESIRLDIQGAAFDAVPEAAVVGPCRTQAIRIWGTPREAGSLTVNGAIIQVRGCRERAFAIYEHGWQPRLEEKAKATGIAALSRSLTSAAIPAPEHMSLRIIPPQPVVVVQSTTLAQSSIMILEGERQAFSVTLRNVSTTTPADLVLFAFEDNTQEGLQAALKNRDATSAELYEYEFALVRRPVLQLRDGQEGKERFIAPGGTADFEFEIYGRPGLAQAVIRINYGHLAVPQDQASDEFYTRHVSVSLKVTVNASVELTRLDVLSPAKSIPSHVWDTAGALEWDQGSRREICEDDQHALLVLDLRNGYPALMTVSLGSNAAPPSSSLAAPIKITEQILPGNVKRVIVPVPRIHVGDPLAPVPSLVPAARQRQFVVSRSVSPEMERATREAFWFRESVLGPITCTWSYGGDGPASAARPRSGAVELRGLGMTGRMIDAVKVDDVGIGAQFEWPGTDYQGPAALASTVSVDDFVQLRITLTNRMARPIQPMLRIQPSLRHRPMNVALDHVRKFAWNGTLQRIAPLLEGGGTSEVVVGVTALCRGEFEVGVTVEEVVLLREEKTVDDENTRPGILGGGGSGERARGVWCSRRPCVLFVKDR